MSRKHFKAMAAELLSIADLSARQVAASAFADMAKSANARFDRQRFMAACGL
jgi:hypothetical protein